MEIPTLFILGAGASKPYGLPLGSELVDLVKSKIRKLEPHPNSLAARNGLPDHVLKSRLEDACSRLDNSRPPSIDAYLRDTKCQYTRQAMASILLEFEQAAFRNKKPPTEDCLSWLYHYRLARQPDAFCSNSLAFASFNYDRLPLGILTQIMSSNFDKRAQNCLEHINTPPDGLPTRFLHIHGCLEPALEGNPGGTIAEMRQIAPNRHHHTEICKSISLIYDDNTSAAEQLSVYLKWAERIVVLGLGWHQEMLDFFSKAAEYNNFDNAEQLFASKNFVGGTAKNLGTVSRNRVTNWSKSIVLGDPNHGCIEFLSEFLE